MRRFNLQGQLPDSCVWIGSLIVVAVIIRIVVLTSEFQTENDRNRLLCDSIRSVLGQCFTTNYADTCPADNHLCLNELRAWQECSALQV